MDYPKIESEVHYRWRELLMSLRDYSTVVLLRFVPFCLGRGVVEMGKQKEGKWFKPSFYLQGFYTAEQHPRHKEFPWTTQLIYRLAALFLNVFYWLYIFLWDQHTISFKDTLLLHTMKVIASTLTERGGWVSFAITPVFSIFKLLFESVHRVTQHWTQHTQCEVLHTHAHTSGNRYSVCGSLLPPKQQYETEEYPEIGNQSVSSSSTEESQLDWMSQFHFPFEVTIRTM